MTGTPPPFKPSNNTEANLQYSTGDMHFSQGNHDVALTWFRRAALSDPDFFSAYVRIGQLCREKARADKMFLRYAYDAFHKAAALDLANEDAHNQFILTASESGRLEELLLAYEKWIAADPDNELLQHCKKNVVTLSMAMIPQAVSVGEGDSSGLKRFVLAGSILFLVLGVAVLTIVPMLVKSGKLKREAVRGVAPVGMVMTTIGMAGFVSRRFL